MVTQDIYVASDKVHRFRSVEDLAIALQTQFQVNHHLNVEVEKYIQQIKSKDEIIKQQQMQINKMHEQLQTMKAFLESQPFTSEPRQLNITPSTPPHSSKPTKEAQPTVLSTAQLPLNNESSERSPHFVARSTSFESSSTQVPIVMEQAADEMAATAPVAAPGGQQCVNGEARVPGQGPGEEEGWWNCGKTGDDFVKLYQQGREMGWLLQEHEIQLEHELGRGCFGITYKAMLHGGVVAVKQLSISKYTDANNFLREIEVLVHTRHPNVVPFVGAVLAPPRTCWLVFEYMSGDTLTTWLYGAKGKARPRRTMVERMQKALEVARGMQALQESTPPIVHRDLKPSNVLLDSAGVARVADLGLARRVLPDTLDMTGETGTYQYMAPEVFRHEVYDTKADVWSWVVLMIELYRGIKPFEDLYLLPADIALGVSSGSIVPTLPYDAPAELHDLVEMCSDQMACMRPEFNEVVNQMSILVIPVLQQMEQHSGFFSRMMGGPSQAVSNVTPHAPHKNKGLFSM